MNEPGTGAVEVAPGRSPLASARGTSRALDGHRSRQATSPGSVPPLLGRPWKGADRRRLLLRRSAGQAAHYRGPDRRPSPPTLAPGRALGLAASLLAAAVALAITYSLARSAHAPGRDADALVVATLTATFATAAGAMSIVNWRVTGRARNVAYGAAFLVLGVAGFGLGVVAPLLRPELRSGISLHLRLAAELTALALVVLGGHLPDVDTRLRPQPLLAVAASAATALAAVLLVLPDRAVTAAFDPLLVFGWSAVGWGNVRYGLQQERWLDTWMGLAALGMAFASAAGVLAHWSGRPPEGPYLTVAVFGTLYAVVAVQQELSLALSRAREQAERMADAVGAAEEIRIRERSEREERDHDLRSAIFALEAAARALGSDHRSGGRTDGGLAAAIATELGRVKAMLAAADRGSRRFAVADALLPIISLELARGVDLRVELPEQLEADGSAAATAEILRNLLDNARRYAPRRPVRVTAERSGDRVLVRVADSGPGVLPEDRLHLFERGWRGGEADAPEGTGLGLFVSARLASEQGGSLAVDESASEGACFVLSLPAAGGVVAGSTGEAPHPRVETRA